MGAPSLTWRGALSCSVGVRLWASAAGKLPSTRTRINPTGQTRPIPDLRAALNHLRQLRPVFHSHDISPPCFDSVSHPSDTTLPPRAALAAAAGATRPRPEAPRRQT